MPFLAQQDLNRALLARQGLLAPLAGPLPRVLSRICGIQAQYAPSMYIGLWSRTPGFSRAALDAALERRRVVQGTLMRITIHLVAPSDYWPFAVATRAARQEQWLRSRRGAISAESMRDAAELVRRRVADGPIRRAELAELIGAELIEGIGQWVDLARVPPSGTWARRRADLFGDAVSWLGPPPAGLDEADAARYLVRRYLAGFGPASRADVANFTGLSLGAVDAALAGLRLRRFASEAGELVDVPGAPLPGGDAEAPVRFLPTFDATLFAHCRRTGILPEEHRPKILTPKNPHSVGTFLVDGRVTGTWRHDAGRIELAPFGRLPRTAQRALREEAARLAELHA